MKKFEMAAIEISKFEIADILTVSAEPTETSEDWVITRPYEGGIF